MQNKGSLKLCCQLHWLLQFLNAVLPSLSNKSCHENLQGFFALDISVFHFMRSCPVQNFMYHYLAALGIDGSLFAVGSRSFIGRLVPSLFSIAMRRVTPSITFWTSSTSEKPNLSRLEISKTLPSAAVSTPPVKSIDYTDKYL